MSKMSGEHGLVSDEAKVSKVQLSQEVKQFAMQLNEPQAQRFLYEIHIGLRCTYCGCVKGTCTCKVIDV